MQLEKGIKLFSMRYNESERLLIEIVLIKIFVIHVKGMVFE